MPIHPVLIDLVFFIIGFALLTSGAEFLVRGASRLAIRLSISAAVVGLTIVAFGTSLPELLVSLVANLDPNSTGEIAIGNIVGSNIANLGLILGVAATLTVVHVESRMVRQEIPLLLIVSVIFLVLAWNGQLGLGEGVILIFGLLLFTYNSYRQVRSIPEQAEDAEQSLGIVETFTAEVGEASTHPIRDILMVLVGLAGLIFGAEWLVSAAESMARTIGVSELLIGLTLVALGTSLPELATTIAAVRQNQADIAIGNVVGSNLFNMLFIGGVSSLVRPLRVPRDMYILDFPVMMVLTVLLIFITMTKPNRLVRWHGFILLAIYFGYIIWLFANGGINPPA